MGQRGESEQDAQGLLGHRKDSTGSQTRARSALDFNRIFSISAALLQAVGGGGPSRWRPPHVARCLPQSSLLTHT